MMDFTGGNRNGGKRTNSNFALEVEPLKHAEGGSVHNEGVRKQGCVLECWF